MKQRIVVLILTLLVCLSAILVIPSEFDIKATGGGGREETQDIGLNYTYVWQMIDDLSYVVHNDTIWGEGDDVICRGRAFCDPDGNVLFGGEDLSSGVSEGQGGGSYLEAWYSFTVTYE